MYGTEPFRNLFCGQAGLSLASNQGHLVADTRLWNMRHVHDGLIHADAAQQWRFLSVNKHISPVGRRAPETIGIPHRKYGNGGRSLRIERAAVTNTFSGGNNFDLCHLGLERERWAKSLWQAHLSRWMQPVERYARAHYIEMRFCQAQNSRAVGGMHQRRAQLLLSQYLQYALEARKLQASMRLIGTISRGEMGKDALKFQAGQFSNAFHQLYHLVN